MKHHRMSVWFDDRQNPIQVSITLLLDWEPRCEATEAVGPFETLSEATERCMAEADNLWHHQIAGQLRLL